MNKLKPVYQEIYDFHSHVMEKSITKRRFHHEDIVPLILDLQNDLLFEVDKVGYSYEGREIFSIKMGNGKTKILAWSQMHGNEPTPTMAIFDIFNFFKQKDSFKDLKKFLLENLTIVFLPMLNPDGTNRFQRHNALGIDINRDAVSLQSPESRLLKSFRDRIKPDFALNLHDQDNAHGAGKNGQPATISFLAPPIDDIKTINQTRENSIKLISALWPILQKFIPNHIGRYSDDFESRAFGENVQKAGTSTILIESGGYKNDPERQFVRKINFTIILSALFLIASGEYKTAISNIYFDIPENEKRLFDLLIRNIIFKEQYHFDIGINRNEREIPEKRSFYYHSNIEEIGDLSGFWGYDELDTNGMNLQMGKIHPKVFNKLSELNGLNVKSLLQQGYTSIRLKPAFEQPLFTNLPLQIITHQRNNHDIKINKNPNFLLFRDNQLRYVVVNGFSYDIENDDISIPNGIIE